MARTPPPLAADEIHVWQARLDLSAQALDSCRVHLTDGERARAQRYCFAAPRRHFTVARGTLRRLLGDYTGIPPAELRLEYGPFGKPVLAWPVADIRFNVSHSGDIVLVACSRGRDVGVDVERTERRVAWDMVARRFFSPQELRDMEDLPEAERRAAFFRCWTRKEAFIKATGQGVAFGLANFAVEVRPQRPPALLWLRDGDAQDWRLQDAAPGAGYAGALCARGSDWQARWLTG